MSLCPGICFCVAPNLPPNSSVLYALRPTGFRLGSTQNTDGVFRTPSARGIGESRPLGGAGAFVRATSGVARIDFFLREAMIGENLASPTQPANCNGYMANTNFTGGAQNRHRRGEGKWFLTSRQLAQRTMSLMTPGVSIKNVGLGANSLEWAEVIDQVRGSGSNTAAWLGQLQHVLASSMNHVAIAYLIFRE